MANPKLHPHPCAFCGRVILKARKTYCSSPCKSMAKYRRRRQAATAV